MRKIILCVSLLVICFCLSAKQVSFLGIWFGQTVVEVDHLLAKQGYIKALEPLTYEVAGSSDINKVELTLDKENLVNGWILYFTPNLPSDRYYSILDEAIKMHGKNYRSKISENSLAWSLDDGKDFRLGFDDNLALQVGVYYDSRSN